MKCWFSCNHHCRRSRYKEDHRLSEIREEGKREKGNQEGGPKEAAVGEGCPPRRAPRAEPQPDGAVEDGDDPESPAKAPQPLGTLPSKEAPAEAQPPSSQPAPSFPIPHHEILGFIQELGAAQERQSRHRRERKKDLRSCHDCLKSIKTLKENLQEVQGRLWKVEAKLGIRVPPHELELEEDEKEPPKEGGGEGEESPLAWAPLPVSPQPGGGAEGSW
ncbi:uncharacterized protein LOC128404213 [Podarcis raffonei]|uniref:uncharacterized protein LOC128404213 n=1 Tax=Podarcis raffonei TaxID=65483 RepID=UPI0023290554|nr:uncharacterized protein LOC128404213 [Podarcis raffonei]